MKRLSFLTVCFCIFSALAFAQTQTAPGNPTSMPLCDLPDGCEDEALPPSAHPSNDLKYPEDVKKYFDAQQQQAEQHAQEKQGLAPNNIGSPTMAAPAPEVEAPKVEPVPVEKVPEPVVETPKVEPAPVEKPAPVEEPKVEKVEVAKPTPPPAPPVPPPAKPAPNFKSDLPEGWEEVPLLKEGEVPLEKVKRR